TSKVILANLPDRTLKSVYLANEETIRRTLKVNDWKSFKDQFRAIRRAGFALTDSEIAKGRVGLAAPISRRGQVVAGISLVALPNRTERSNIESYVPGVIAAAAEISKRLSKEEPLTSPCLERSSTASSLANHHGPIMPAGTGERMRDCLAARQT